MESSEKTKFVYTASSRKHMIPELIKSIKSLKRWVDEQNIIVYFTPPVNNEDRQIISELGVEIREKKHITEALNPGNDIESHFGDKLWLCECESENVVFLDCDTIILDNIWDVLEGDFDFKARPAGKQVNEDQNWQRMFEEKNIDHLPWMPNAGFMIFKNTTHNQIADRWKDFFQDINYVIDGKNFKDQYSLALAISEQTNKIEKMDEKEHVLEWKNQKEPHGYVYHLLYPENTPLNTRILSAVDRRLPIPLEKIYTRLNPKKKHSKLVLEK